ncbi:Heterokaryon incompatibility [Aspergillus oryzae]|uniref:Heterokaryon incompatibility n=1 Tax=Aspergillus oryzae TaxID=5062 RepID=A0A1S9DG73_ASPOZ|nr:Heterokaryon incompatibility [Aspergillus oryzae]
MGIQYLWVDRLCIIQDHVHEKGIQINAMGTIYTNSYVTLVGLEGHDANHGLPGVFEEEPPRRQVLRVEDIVLTGLYDHRRYEKLVGRIPLFGAHMDPPGEEYWPSQTFSDLLEGYTKRAFSHESDILRAISGILNSFYESHHYFGLPFSVFDNAILWNAADTTYSTRNPTSGDVFPSWSWVSVKGGITTYNLPLQTLAVWAVASTDSDFLPQPLKVIAPWERPLANERQYYKLMPNHSALLILAWKEGCFSGKLPEELKPAANWSKIERLAQKRWGANGQHRMIQDALGLGQNLDYNDKFSPEHISLSCSSPGGIMMYTQSVRVRVVPPQNLSGRFDEHIKLYAEAGEVVACVSDGSMVCKDWRGRSLCKYELGLKNVPIVNLMVVDTQDGVSRRVALAETYLKIWVKAERKFGTFVIV